jgi:CO/xanthine dehydrogenase Mo-binding subunit
MAYWQNGKLHLFGSTQSTARTHSALASMLDLKLDDVVFVGQYCGGGFGSKIAGSPIMAVPALLSRQLGRPVMLRVTRYEENYFGRARPAQQARVRMGWRDDGKVTAIDLFMVQDHGPYGASGDHQTASAIAALMYQPHAMRFRGISIYTNTPPRSAQRQPGGAQIAPMLEPLMDKAARELGIDRVEMRRVNAPDHDSTFGPGQSGLTTAYVREAIDIGANRFGWSEKTRLSGRREGTKLTGIGVGVSPFVGGSFGYDGLLVIRPDGDLYIHQGTGNLGTHSFADTARAAADVLGMSWERCHVIWGDTAEHLPWSSYQAGSQTAHAHSRANHAAASDAKRKLQEIAARDLGGAPDAYETADGRVFRPSSPAQGMSFAQAARRAIELGGAYSGQELPEDIHEMTIASAQGLAGQGLMGVAKDNYARETGPWSFVIGFAQVEVDAETGEVEIKEYMGVADCGTVLHPRGLAAQIHGGAVQGFGMARSQKWVFDPRWGVPFAYRLYTARPPGILDGPLTMDWAAVNEPDPQNPVGAKGIGEPPIGAGAAAITSAIADALGGTCLCRTPLTTDVILAELEGREQPYRKLDTHV